MWCGNGAGAGVARRHRVVGYWLAGCCGMVAGSVVIGMIVVGVKYIGTIVGVVIQFMGVAFWSVYVTM